MRVANPMCSSARPTYGLDEGSWNAYTMRFASSWPNRTKNAHHGYIIALVGKYMPMMIRAQQTAFSGKNNCITTLPLMKVKIKSE